jgi:CheY-like chemotaxis protein
MAFSISTRRLLCVEDNDDTSRMLEFLLTPLGLQMTCVTTATEALQIIGSAEVALCIIDNRLPDMTGTELCSLIRQIDRCKELPLIIYSGAAREEDREEGLRAGADVYVAKPAIEELIITVQKFIGEHSPA